MNYMINRTQQLTSLTLQGKQWGVSFSVSVTCSQLVPETAAQFCFITGLNVFCFAITFTVVFKMSLPASYLSCLYVLNFNCYNFKLNII